MAEMSTSRNLKFGDYPERTRESYKNRSKFFFTLPISASCHGFYANRMHLEIFSGMD